MAFEELKERQRAMWGAGGYEPVVEITREIHAALIEALAPRPGDAWLDLATGTGAVALLAAEAGARVTGLDLSPVLVASAREKAAARGLEIDFLDGDAEALPFDDASFDVVSSAIGIQFAPDHAAVARELARVCRPGARLGLACWTPDGGVGRMFALLGRFSPPLPEGAGRPVEWGREEHVLGLLGDAFDLAFAERDTPLRVESGEAFWELMSEHFGPVNTLAASLDETRREELHRDWVDFFERERVGDGIVHSRTYLLVTGTRR